METVASSKLHEDAADTIDALERRSEDTKLLRTLILAVTEWSWRRASGRWFAEDTWAVARSARAFWRHGLCALVIHGLSLRQQHPPPNSIEPHRTMFFCHHGTYDSITHVAHSFMSTASPGTSPAIHPVLASVFDCTSPLTLAVRISQQDWPMRAPIDSSDAQDIIRILKLMFTASGLQAPSSDSC
jgi:hypothetical protein